MLREVAVWMIFGAGLAACLVIGRAPGDDAAGSEPERTVIEPALHAPPSAPTDWSGGPLVAPVPLELEGESDFEREAI